MGLWAWRRLQLRTCQASGDALDYVHTLKWIRSARISGSSAGISVNSSLGYDIYKLGYLWSFYRSDKVELAAGAGLHMAGVRVGLGVDSAIIDSELRTAKSNLPMPVLSFMLDYNVTSKFEWYFRSQLFAIDLGDWRGVYSDIELGMKYQLFENIGVGAGIGSNGLEVVREEDATRFEFENRVTGLRFFVTANF